jgi:hypothetical protein
LALDTYFRGNSQELEFCQKVHAGGNHLTVATAGGKVLGKEGMKLRERDLAGALEEYARLSKEERKPALEDPAAAQPPKRPVPQPPANGLIIRGFCTYLHTGKDKRSVRADQYYYKENPDRWKAETQSDLLWLTEAEWKSLIPANPHAGDRIDVAGPIQQRFYSTIGIDYMEGSVNSLPTREQRMTVTVEKVDGQAMLLRLDGYGQMGKEFNEKLRGEKESRGCELRVLGHIVYNRQKSAIERLDLVGIGRAWGNKMGYVHREIRIDDYPWLYGIACELVTGDGPQDRIPPYNLLHYNSSGPYWGK